MLMLIAFACQQHRELPDWLDLTAAWGRLVYQPWGPLHTASLQLKQCGRTKARVPFPQKKLRSVVAQALKVDTLASEFAQIMALHINLLPGGLPPTTDTAAAPFSCPLYSRCFAGDLEGRLVHNHQYKGCLFSCAYSTPPQTRNTSFGCSLSSSHWFPRSLPGALWNY